MKHLKLFCLLALVCFAMSAFAQAAKPAATPNAQAKKTEPPSIASAVDQQISIVERSLSAPPRPCRMTSSISPCFAQHRRQRI